MAYESVIYISIDVLKENEKDFVRIEALKKMLTSTKRKHTLKGYNFKNGILVLNERYKS